MVFDKVKKVIMEQLSIDEEEIKLDSSLTDDLGVDSLEIFEIVMSLEEEFDIEIKTEDTENIKTVKDIVNYIEERLK